MRILICGDRNWDDETCIFTTVAKVFMSNKKIGCIIEGDARGADRLAGIIAHKLNIELLEFPADWEKHGRAAGPIRNSQMLKEGKPTHVWAFHNDIKVSKGTKDMLCKALAVLPANRVKLYTEKGEVKITKELLR